MLLQFYKNAQYISIKSPIFKLTGTLKSGIFELEKKWYIRVSFDDNIINQIDSECMNYVQKFLNSMYKSCNFENSVLIKIPYRYKKYEAKCENCTFYDLSPNQTVELSFAAVSLSLLSNAYCCTFKLHSIKLIVSTKHPHALLESATDE